MSPAPPLPTSSGRGAFTGTTLPLLGQGWGKDSALGAPPQDSQLYLELWTQPLA